MTCPNTPKPNIVYGLYSCSAVSEHRLSFVLFSIRTFYLFSPGLQEPSLLGSKSEKYCRSCKMGSLSNNDGNENGRKPIGLIYFDKKNNFARASRFFCTFPCYHCATTTWNFLTSRFLEDVNTRQLFNFSFCELRYSPLEFNSWKNDKWRELE